ncbi:MAG TPA: DUF2339 domain-containing protein, partial [Candidatus Limnocylindrales bacterium]
MDLMLLIIVLAVVFVLVLLWVKTDEVARRQERAEKDAVALEARLEKLQWKVAKLASAPTTTAVQAREAATPVVAPAAPPVMPAAAPPRPAAAASGPAIPLQRSAPPPPARRGWVAREEIPDPAAYGPVTSIEPTPGPRGPGLVERVLRQLDLAPSTPDGGWSRGTLEAWLEGRMLAIVGGIALLLGAIFFLSLAFSRGWITEPLRVLIGLVAGAALLVLGELSFTRLRGALGHVLVAVGLAIISLALLAATRLYHVVPVEWGLLGAFVAAVAAAAIAVRHDSQVVAA